MGQENQKLEHAWNGEVCVCYTKHISAQICVFPTCTTNAEKPAYGQNSVIMVRVRTCIIYSVCSKE